MRLAIDGCYLYDFYNSKDSRGGFSKYFAKDFFSCWGLGFSVAEVYSSYSKKNVLRGMHFQLPPVDHDKIVVCLSGQIFDVLFDLRMNSKSYGKALPIVLDSHEMKAIFVARGVAHGFYVLSEMCHVLYIVSSSYSQAFDSGVRWDSVPVNWPIPPGVMPIVSERDLELPLFNDGYESPF